MRFSLKLGILLGLLFACPNAKAQVYELTCPAGTRAVDTLTTLDYITGLYRQNYCVSPNGTVTENSTVNLQTLTKIVYLASSPYSVICDGVTVNSANIISGIAAGGQGAHVIFPSGICLVSVESGTFNVYDGSWYSGGGKFATIIKRANGGSANNSIFTVASGGAFGTVGNVMFTDATIDGNYLNQTGGGDNITGTSPTSKFTALRMRIINSWSGGIALRLGTGNNADVLIADNDFESNGLRAGCVGTSLCWDTNVQASLRVRIMRNRSEGAQNFTVHSGHNGAGTLTISENVVNNCLGFAVALGGGGTNPGPAAISDNTFNCPTSNQNVIDLALWSDARVENNTVTAGTAFYGIADGPPANKVQLIGNHIIGNATNAGCIALGSNDSIIQANYCNGSGGAGIQLTPLVAGQKNLVIKGNIVKNTSQASSGVRGGIDVSINAGTSIASVVIEGNRSFDDLGAGGTQGYGIALGSSGQASGFSNFTIEGNDVRGNKTAGILNSATPTTNFVIANNPGGESAILCQLTVCPTQTIGSNTVTTNGTGIAAGTTQIQPGMTITGTLSTDVATCSFPSNPPATWQTGIQLLPPVPSSNTVTLFISNPTAALITPAAIVIRCTVTR